MRKTELTTIKVINQLEISVNEIKGALKESINYQPYLNLLLNIE